MHFVVIAWAAIIGPVRSAVVVSNNIALANNVEMVIVVFVYNIVFVYNVVPVFYNMLMPNNGLLPAAIEHLPVNRFWANLRPVVELVELMEKTHAYLSFLSRLIIFYAVQEVLLQAYTPFEKRTDDYEANDYKRNAATTG